MWMVSTMLPMMEMMILTFLGVRVVLAVAAVVVDAGGEDDSVEASEEFVYSVLLDDENFPCRAFRYCQNC